MEISFIFLIILAVAVFVVGYWVGKLKAELRLQGTLKDERKDAILKSRAVLGGHFSENLAPYLPNFPFIPTECRFVGKPVDFIVFKGMDEKKIDEIVFVEVKSGEAAMNKQEKNLKDTIDNKRVRFVEYRIPKELTQKGDIEDKIKELTDKE